MLQRVASRTILVLAATSLLGACASTPFDAVASKFKYRVPFETGQTQAGSSDRLVVSELWGTRPQLEVGGEYLVVGTYSLESLENASICFYLTALNWDNSGPDLDLQRTTVHKGTGAFALVHSMNGPGYFHVSMSGERASEYVRVANVYFGTDDNLLREESASQRAP